MNATSNPDQYTLSQRFAAYLVHAYTASGAVIGLFALHYIVSAEYVTALWWMLLAILIDATDGNLARRCNVKAVTPNVDGALMDNILDYFNYVIVPCFLLMLHPTMLPEAWSVPIICLIALASVYQFTQCDAKTPDHFFKGFPSYWNIVVIYLFVFQSSQLFNACILILFAILVFVPIKYVYPSRLDYLTDLQWLRRLMFISSVLYCANLGAMLWFYPDVPSVVIAYAYIYVIFYFAFSLFRTYVPLLKRKYSPRS